MSLSPDVQKTLEQLRVCALQLHDRVWTALRSYLQTHHASQLKAWDIGSGDHFGQQMQAHPDLHDAVRQFLLGRHHTRSNAYMLGRASGAISNIHENAKNRTELVLPSATVQSATEALPNAWHKFCAGVDAVLLDAPAMPRQDQKEALLKLGRDMMTAAGDGLDIAFVTGVLVGAHDRNTH